jgi:rhodanese-related sulfurtransferase
MVIPVLILLLFLSACQNKGIDITGENVIVGGGTYTNVNAQQLNTMLRNKDFIFVNVHIPFAGDITNTDLSIPYNEIEQNLSQLPSNKNEKIVLYCRSGRMSEIAAEELVLLGYTNVWNLTGGMVNWEQIGYEIEP